MLNNNSDVWKVKSNMKLKEIKVVWFVPPHNWVKIISKGVSKGNNQSTGCGGVITGLDGEWLHGYACNLDVCLVVKAKLWGVQDGLNLAQNLDFKKLFKSVILYL